MASAKDRIGFHFIPNGTLFSVVHHHGRKSRVAILDRLDFRLVTDENGAATQPEQQGSRLRQALQSVRYRFPRSAAVSLPEEHCYQLTVGIQQPDAATDLGEAVRWEVAQHLPYDRSELIMDWTVVSTEKKTLLIQVCAAPKNIVESHCALLEAAGYDPCVLEPVSLSATRTLALPALDPLLCIILGDVSTTLVIISGACIPMTINSRHCTDDRITDLFMHKLHLSDHDANKAKTVCGFDPAINRGEVRAILLDELKAVLSDIASAQAFLTEHGAPKLRGIVLTGPGSLVKHIDREIAQQTQLPVFLHPPRKDVTITHVPHRETAARTAQFSSAIGVALRR